jgi:hypothetical protein
VIGNKPTWEAWRRQSVERVVIVKHKIEHAGRGNLGVINLDFIGLRERSVRRDN